MTAAGNGLKHPMPAACYDPMSFSKTASAFLKVFCMGCILVSVLPAWAEAPKGVPVFQKPAHSVSAPSESSGLADLTGRVSRPFVGSWADYGLSVVLLILAILLAKRRVHSCSMRWAVSALSLFLGLRYLYWRGVYTLNTHDMLNAGGSLILYVAEVYGFFSLLLFYVLAVKPTGRPAAPPGGQRLPAVDIFIAAGDASLDPLYRTLVGCVALEYPAQLKTVYVLDDHHRDEAKRLTEGLGCRYTVAPSGSRARAAKLDHALTRSSGELVMVLDSGDVPVAGFLGKTVGFFDDPERAFVQTAVYAPTPDLFRQALLLGRDIAHEQEFFLNVIEPGLDRYGAAVIWSRGVIFRRAALDDISGFGSDDTNADLYRSSLLHSRGWRSAYLNQNLVLQTTAEKPETFFNHRAGRIRQALRLLLKGLPVWPKLTFSQRRAYLGLLLTDLSVFPRLIFIIAPLAFLLGAVPIVAPFGLLLAYFIPFFVGQMIARNMVSNGHRHPLWSSVYETADIAALLTRITGAEPRSPRRAWLLPLLTLGAMQVLGILTGTVLAATGTVSWTPALIGGVWAFYNLNLLAAAAASVRGRTPKRSHPRLFQEVACQLIAPDRRWTVKTLDLSESGLSLNMAAPAALPEQIEIELGGAPTFVIRGVVKRNEAFPWGGASVGIHFSAMSDRQKQDFVRWLYCRHEAWEGEGPGARTHQSALLGFLTAPVRAFIREGDLHRSAPRYLVDFPCRLILRDRVMAAATLDVSATGASLKMDEDPGPLPHEAVLEIRISGRTASLRGRPVWSRHREGHWEIGIHFESASGLRLLDAVLSRARVKVVPVESLQARVLRLMGWGAAYALSLLMTILVVVVFIRTGAVPIARPTDLKSVYKFFWLLLFFILVDGVKVFIEIAHRALPRRYESDLSQVTALIPCHNTGKAVEYTIEGLRRFLPGDRIVIIDDASTDQTAEIARRAGVRVYSLKENAGKPKAIGIGLKWVQTRYTLLLDDDTRLQNMFLPTSLLEEGNTGVAFYVLPCRRTRENFDGKDFVSCLQRYEYAKSMEIGRRFQDKTLSVSCISGAAGLFQTDRLRALYPLHSNLFPGEDLERTLIDLLHDGRIAFVNEAVWTTCPDNWKGLTRQRLIGWYPGFYRLLGYYLKILFSRKMPSRLRFEMLYNLYVIVSDPLKIYSFVFLLFHRYWAGLAFIYFFYLALEIYPFLTVEKKMPVIRYYLPAFFLYPAYGIYNTFLRFASLFVWLWHRFVTQKWKPKREAVVAP